jgi:hypothetical protein
MDEVVLMQCILKTIIAVSPSDYSATTLERRTLIQAVSQAPPQHNLHEIGCSVTTA